MLLASHLRFAARLSDGVGRSTFTVASPGLSFTSDPLQTPSVLTDVSNQITGGSKISLFAYKPKESDYECPTLLTAPFQQVTSAKSMHLRNMISTVN